MIIWLISLLRQTSPRVHRSIAGYNPLFSDQLKTTNKRLTGAACGATRRELNVPQCRVCVDRREARGLETVTGNATLSAVKQMWCQFPTKRHYWVTLCSCGSCCTSSHWNSKVIYHHKVSQWWQSTQFFSRNPEEKNTKFRLNDSQGPVCDSLYKLFVTCSPSLGACPAVCHTPVKVKYCSSLIVTN